jgi:hypothetical protein
MNKTVALAVAGALTLALASTAVLADDETPSSYTQDVQKELKKESDMNKAKAAQMTPEEKATAKNAKDAQTLKYQNMIEKATQDPGEQRGISISKSAEASKADPKPRRGYINTPEAEARMMKNKGQ